MTLNIPKEALSFQDYEDLNSLQISISDLFDQFIKPIDLLRSQAWPVNIDFNSETINFQTSNLEIFESRCHAFYRVLGMPVIGQSSFYNPGFIPGNIDNLNSKIKIKNEFINKKDFSNLFYVREQKCINQKNIFLKQDLYSSIYAIMLKYPAPFALFNNDSSLQNDEQKFTIKDRQLEIEKIAEININLKDTIIKYAQPASIVQKLLKPFAVDPRIEISVSPDIKQICVPFLPTKESCQLQKDIYLQRPGIELILRQRLTDTTNSNLFLTQVEQILNKTNEINIDISDISYFSIIDSLQAISSYNKLNNDTKDILNNFSNYQILIINQLTKYIKFCIKKLVESIQIIDMARYQIYWYPLFSADGPITGRINAKLFSGLKNNNSLLEQKIIDLEIKKLNAQRSRFDFQSLGDFASPFKFNNNLEIIEDLDQQLSNLKNKKNIISNNAFDAISTIEKIVGEISGLGLIDVLAIYLTFWSIDVNILLHFLDDNAFERLVAFNPELAATAPVQIRKSSGRQMNIEETLNKFQSTLYNVLSYADKIYQTYVYSNI